MTCENPDDEESKRVYRKEFGENRILLPGELDEAKAFIRDTENTLVLAATGYSSIKDEDLKAWGIKPGAYEAAVEDVLGTLIKALQGEFPAANIRLLDGASDMGVDRAAISVATKLGIPRLGFSCPAFMFYVKDDGSTIYCADNQPAYSDAFVQTLDVLYSLGGRMQALEHDMLAAIKYDKRLMPLNVLRAISSNGGPPARAANGSVQDANAAFEKAIRVQFLGRYSDNPFDDLRKHACEATKSVAREILEPSAAFGSWQR